ncbi:hypothetical protein LCGC14_3155960 [marine sediment metagenome]|uniref:Uncharacterized protein n=1 Tax=marine sediment metagenome TaxID=412755 RepID=A0A0F8XZI7_9ZZZZ
MSIRQKKDGRWLTIWYTGGKQKAKEHGRGEVARQKALTMDTAIKTRKKAAHKTERGVPAKTSGPEYGVLIQLSQTLKDAFSEESVKTEVWSGIGYADIVTPLEVIEIKWISGWKGAIGQVLLYNKAFPGRRKRIHLYGMKCSEQHKEKIRSICKEYDIRVTFALI